MLPLAIFSVNLLSENLLLLSSILVFAAIMMTKVGARFGVPSLLLFLIIGMVVGQDGLGLKFEDYELAESIGHFAMTIILFTGGLETSLSDIKPMMKQGVLLATLGVFITGMLTGGFIYMIAGKVFGILGSSLIGCFLMAFIMSSTDSASVFSLLRGRNLRFKHNLGPMLELESGSNDPMAYLLTIMLTSLVVAIPEGKGPFLMTLEGVLALVLQMGAGFGVGLGVGYLTVLIVKKIKLPGASLYSILILSSAFFSSGLAGMLKGNGLLALYVCAIIIGNNATIPQKKDVLKFFDGMTWLMQLLMFLMLGLLARPTQMPPVLVPALMIALFMMFVARPASVFLSLLPFRKLPFKAKLFTSWVGLRGAGPILFALYPVVMGIDGASDIFNIVFIVTLVSMLLQGMTLVPLSKWLGLSYDIPSQAETFGMEIPEEMGMLRDHTVTEADLVGNGTLREMGLPHGIRVMMVKRDDKMLVPHGSMKLFPGDHLVIIMGESDD